MACDLSESIWAHRIARHGATEVNPLELVHGQKAILPIKVNQDAYRLAKQYDLFTSIYHDLMMDNINEVDNKQLKALKEIENDKARLARALEIKRVRLNLLQVGDLV